MNIHRTKPHDAAKARLSSGRGKCSSGRGLARQTSPGAEQRHWQRGLAQDLPLLPSQQRCPFAEALGTGRAVSAKMGSRTSLGAKFRRWQRGLPMDQRHFTMTTKPRVGTNPQSEGRRALVLAIFLARWQLLRRFTLAICAGNSGDFLRWRFALASWRPRF